MNKSEQRAKAEKEANEDLSKSNQQLLHDIHDEALNLRIYSPEMVQVHVMKRFSSLIVKNIEASDRLSDRMLWLTWAAVIVGVGQILLAIAQVILALIQLC